jgi:hypothetical protein
MSDFDTQVRVVRNDEPIIRLEANLGRINAGNAGIAGQLRLADGNNERVIVLDAKTGRISVGRNSTIQLASNLGRINVGNAGIAGQLRLADGNNKSVIFLDANTARINLGRNGLAGTIRIANTNNKAAIFLNGDTGDIILTNADCAEEFDVAEDIIAEPGMVMVLDGGSALRPCRSAYDKRVAGVLSGAGNYKPGIVLDRKPSAHARMALAIVGKVYCMADAQYGAIEIGDLLTTSPTLGHAMKAIEPGRAFGAVIGKALQALNSGTGLVPLLVALQ